MKCGYWMHRWKWWSFWGIWTWWKPILNFLGCSIISRLHLLNMLEAFSYSLGHSKSKNWKKKLKKNILLELPKPEKRFSLYFLERQIFQIAISLKLLVYHSCDAVHRFLQVRQWGIGEKIMPLTLSGAEIWTIFICP